MNKYIITITMDDGSVAKAYGLFASAWDAIDSAMTTFADAKRIGAMRLV